MSRIVSVWLPRWPILRLLAAQAKNPSGKPVDPDRPFVLAMAGSRRTAHRRLERGGRGGGACARRAVGRRAGESGIFAGRAPSMPPPMMPRCAGCALWATRYTPTASPWDEENGADGFFLDIEGAAHLFGGEERLIADLSARLEKISACRRGSPSPTRPARPGRCRAFTPRAMHASALGPGSRGACAAADRSVAAFAGNLRDAAPARLQNRRRAAGQTARAVRRAFSRRTSSSSRPGARPRRRAARPVVRAAGLSLVALSARADHHPGGHRRAGAAGSCGRSCTCSRATMSARARCGFPSIASTARSRRSISR